MTAAQYDEIIIACTLDRSLVQERLEHWRALVSTATAVEPDATGVRLRFGREADVSAVAALAAAEHECCPFFSFTVQIAPDGLSLQVSAPEQARPLVDALLGIDDQA